MREVKRGRFVLGNFYGVPLGRMATVAPMVPTPYLAEERPTKKLPTQNIRYMIKIKPTASQPDY